MVGFAGFYWRISRAVKVERKFCSCGVTGSEQIHPGCSDSEAMMAEQSWFVGKPQRVTRCGGGLEANFWLQDDKIGQAEKMGKSEIVSGY